MPAASHGITLQVDWADRRQEPGTHAAQVQRISKLVNLDPSQQAADSGDILCTRDRSDENN
jgi:hypothetical protein